MTGRFGEGWLADVRRTTLVAFGFLTVGIVLGAWWSYEVLGWGGYWGWDPVENASLLPWLTAIAFIHSVMVQERRGMLRVWNLSLVIATFCLTILGTFLTRSGVLNSVHAFSTSSIGPWLLTFLGVCAARRGRPHRVARRPAARRRAASTRRCRARRRSSLNNLLFAALRVRRATRHGVPAPRRRRSQGKQISVGEPYFDTLGVPIGLALLFLMAVGARAAVAGGRAAEMLRNRLLVPAWIGGLTMRRVRARRARGIADVVAFGLGAFVLASIGAFGVRRRPRAAAGHSASRCRSRRCTRCAANPRLYGGLARAHRRRRARDGAGDHVGIHHQA